MSFVHVIQVLAAIYEIYHQIGGRDPAAERGHANKGSNIQSYETPDKASYIEILGPYGMRRVRGSVVKAQRAVAQGDLRLACEAGNELRHLMRVLERPELAALRYDLSGFEQELRRSCP